MFERGGKVHPRDITKQKIKKILLICPGSLGDNLLISPSIKKIRETFKDAEIEIIVGRRAIGFVDGNPWFSNYYLSKGGKGFRRFLNTIKLVNSFQNRRYDLIIDFKNSLIPFFIKGRYRLTFFMQEFFSEKTYTHEAKRLYNFLVPYFGEEENISLHFPISQKERDNADLLLKTMDIKPSDRIALFNPGGNEKKRLSEEKLAEVGKALLKSYDSLKILIIGANQEQEIGDRINALIDDERVFNLAGKTTIKQLAALLERASLVITNDTGTLHLASAMHCPTVAIFGPTSHYRYGPIGTKNIVVYSDISCFPCNEKRVCGYDYRCIKQITPEEVIKASMLLLDEAEQSLFLGL